MDCFDQFYKENYDIQQHVEEMMTKPDSARIISTFIFVLEHKLKTCEEQLNDCKL